ncbi:hypothetical protein N1851_019535 [Merluccius polli]|uniref:Uncharacterized protein n=1 Tax=Merluccius polli TaxID=89951 RepID=A0AA47MLG3_MERPO|nr:hypothetical protein N1851_019535 [Merluccius polli]
MVTCPFPSPPSDPNKGLDVPVTWPRFQSHDQQYLEINSKMDRGFVGQNLRLRYVHFWGSILPDLPFIKYE